MTEETRRAVLDAIVECYGGAFAIAHIHGYKYTGEVTEDDWPKKLIAALTAHEAQIKIETAKSIREQQLAGGFDFDEYCEEVVK